MGITAIELADGRPPYAEIHPMRAMFMIPTKPSATVRHPDMFSSGLNDFIAKCLVKDSSKRASSSQLLQTDPFIKNCKQGSILCDIIDLAIKQREKVLENDLAVKGSYLFLN